MNPYQAPHSAGIATPTGSVRSFSLLQALGIVVISAIGFGIGGCLLGLLIGSLAPDYYRTVFNIPADSSINLTQLGMGLGLTQGVIVGAIVGVAIVLAVAWYRSRASRQGVPSR